MYNADNKLNYMNIITPKLDISSYKKIESELAKGIFESHQFFIKEGRIFCKKEISEDICYVFEFDILDLEWKETKSILSLDDVKQSNNKYNRFLYFKEFDELYNTIVNHLTVLKEKWNTIIDDILNKNDIDIKNVKFKIDKMNLYRLYIIFYDNRHEKQEILIIFDNVDEIVWFGRERIYSIEKPSGNNIKELYTFIDNVLDRIKNNKELILNNLKKIILSHKISTLF